LTLSAWIERSLREGLGVIYWAVADKKYYREREDTVRKHLHRWFRDVMIPVYAEWKALAAQIANMR